MKKNHNILMGEQNLLALNTLKKDLIQSKNINSQKLLEKIEHLYLYNKMDDEYKIQNLLQEAQKFTNKVNESDIDSAKLHKFLEEIIKIKSNNNDFKTFFDSYEKSHRALMQLDYSPKPLLSDTSKKANNLFDYILSALTLSIEKIESSTVSRKGIGSLFRTIPALQNIIVIITDKEEKIRFISENSEDILNIKYSEILNQPIRNLFENHHIINENIQNTGTINNMMVNLVVNKGTTFIPAKLDLIYVKELDEHEDEIPEILYVLNTDKGTNESTKECFIDIKKIIHNIINFSYKMFSCLSFLSKNIFFFSKKFSKKKKQSFYKNLHTLLSSGLNINTALEMICKDVNNKTDKKILLTIIDSVSKGQRLSEAMKQSGFFSPYEYLSIKIGEDSGKLLIILKDLSTYSNKK